MFSKIFHYPGPLWRLHSIVAALTFILISPPMMIGLVIACRVFKAKPAFVTRYIRVWIDILVWLYQVKIVVEGQENDVTDKACLVVCNHQSYFDIPATLVALRGNVRMLAKQELFMVPFFGWSMKAAGYIPIKRSSRGSAYAATEAMAAALKEGIPMWVAPEGTRSKDGQIATYRKGAFSVAMKQKLPIQPLRVIQTRSIMPRSGLLPRPGQSARIQILPAVQTEGAKDAAQLAEFVRSRVIAAGPA